MDKEVDLTSADIPAVTVTEKTHQWDPNLAQDKIDELFAATRYGDPEAVRKAGADFNENSPYESVRAAVKNIDGGEPANTVRAWILGMSFVTVASGLNMFLSMRSPAINFPPIVVLLLVYPCGIGFAKMMPTWQFNTFGLRWTLNPGPFNIKEHSVITLMAGISITYAYSTDALLALLGKPFYNIQMSWGFQLLFTISSQVIGIGLAGLFRRILVWPAALIWPSQFSSTAVLFALHADTDAHVTANSWRVSRSRYFVYVTVGMFIYYWFPGVIWQGLQVFAFITWYALPKRCARRWLIRKQDQAQQCRSESVVWRLHWAFPSTFDLRLDLRVRLSL
jgi:OPT family oligopeptide transporter